MKPVRPFRANSVYASPCVDCQEEIESETLPVPLRCRHCQAKHDKALNETPSPVRSDA